MHVLIAFVLGIGLFAGFQPMLTPEKEEMYLVLDRKQQVRVRTEVETLKEQKEEHLVSQNFDYSCGSAALATLLNYHLGESFSERQVIQGLMNYGNLKKIKKRRAFSFLDMKRFVDVLGYDGQGYKADMEDLRDLEVPVVLPIELHGYQHFVVLRGFRGDRIFLADPWLGHSSYLVQEFQEMWYRNVLFMVDPNDRATANMLSLSKEDLRYISGDEARRALFHPSRPHWKVPRVREHKQIRGGVYK